MKDRILITGASGLLGSTLVPYLRTCGFEVVGHARGGAAEVHAELTDADQVNAVLDQVRPDVIVNLAACTNVDMCQQNPQLAYLSNVRVVENLAMWIRKSGNICYLVQISTDQVYDGIGPHKEENVNLTNYYGFSKYAGEIVASTVPSTTLRTNFFGPSRSFGRNSLSDWLIKKLKKGEPITVFSDIFFSPLSLYRLTELVEIVIVKRRKGVFNLGSKDGMTKADFALACADVLGLSASLINRDASSRSNLFAFRPKDMRMDSSLFEVNFDINLPTLTEEILSMKVAYKHESK